MTLKSGHQLWIEKKNSRDKFDIRYKGSKLDAFMHLIPTFVGF